MKNISVILASRISSTRLPQKSLKPIANCESMLELIIKRLRKSKTIHNIIVATDSKSFEYFSPILKKLNCDYFIGSENDVLDRYVKASKEYNVDIVVRATGDNPLVGIKALDMIVDYHIKSNSDLSHYNLLPYGSGVEVINSNILEIANQNSKDTFEHEHITQYHYRNKTQFKISYPDAPNDFNMPELRLTVDTLEDYNNVIKIFNKYNNNIYIDIDEIISDIRNNK